MTAYAEPECSVFVGNLDSRVTEEILWEHKNLPHRRRWAHKEEEEEEEGPLDGVRIPTDKETGKNRAFGFVEFTSPASVNYACQLLDGIHLYGRPITVKAQKRNNTGSPATNNNIQTPPNRNSPPVFSPEINRQDDRGSPNFLDQLQRSFSHPGNRPTWQAAFRPQFSPMIMAHLSARGARPFSPSPSPESYPRWADPYNR